MAAIQMIQEIVGNALLLISVAFTFIGIFGVFKFDNFYAKVLASSKIDTTAMITLIFGVVIRSGFTWFSLKALLVLVFILFINPIVTSKIVGSAREDELCQLEGKCKVSRRKGKSKR